MHCKNLAGSDVFLPGVQRRRVCLSRTILLLLNNNLLYGAVIHISFIIRLAARILLANNACASLSGIGSCMVFVIDPPCTDGGAAVPPPFVLSELPPPGLLGLLLPGADGSPGVFDVSGFAGSPPRYRRPSA